MRHLNTKLKSIFKWLMLVFSKDLRTRSYLSSCCSSFVAGSIKAKQKFSKKIEWSCFRRFTSTWELLSLLSHGKMRTIVSFTVCWWSTLVFGSFFVNDLETHYAMGTPKYRFQHPSSAVGTIKAYRVYTSHYLHSKHVVAWHVLSVEEL